VEEGGWHFGFLSFVSRFSSLLGVGSECDCLPTLFGLSRSLLSNLPVLISTLKPFASSFLPVPLGGGGVRERLWWSSAAHPSKTIPEAHVENCFGEQFSKDAQDEFLEGAKGAKGSSVKPGGKR